MSYHYFVSYYAGTQHGSGFGRCRITTDRPISGIERIEEIERMIGESNSVQNLLIINFKQFDPAPAPEDDGEKRES